MRLCNVLCGDPDMIPARRALLCESRLNDSVATRYVSGVMTDAHENARKYRFCATCDCVREFSVSRQCAKAFGDFRTIFGDTLLSIKPRESGDASAGWHWGSGVHWSLAEICRVLKSCACAQ
jgi:hypothetical protein